MSQYWIDSGSRSVCITVQGSLVWATTWVDNRNVICSARWTGRTEAGAKRFAAKWLSR